MADKDVEQTATKSSGFSLSLKGVSTKKSAFDKNLVRDRDVKEETNYVTEISERTLKSTRKSEKRKEYVVPLLEDDNHFRKKLALKYGTEKKLRIKDEPSDGGDLHIKQEAHSPSSDDGRSVTSSSKMGKLALPADSYGESSTLENYEEMPLEEIGWAMLRGMGAKIEEADKYTLPTEIKVRPKGLGLGAEVQTEAQREHAKRVEEAKASNVPLILKTGAYVKVLRGAHEGKYGQVEGFSEDAGRVHICLALSKEKISCNEAFVGVVTKEEYNERGKCLNIEMFDDYKRKHDTKSQTDAKFDVGSLAQSELKTENGRKQKENIKKAADKRPFIGYWLRSQIRVRIIDEKFKEGKFLDQKVVIEDVLSRDSCLCRTDQGQLLEDVHMDMLETVVPRSKQQSKVPVVVVAGKHKGQMGFIIECDKKNGEAHVQFESDMSVHRLMLDYICEYVGEL